MFVPIGDLFLKTVKKYRLGSVAEAAIISSTFMKVAEQIFSNVSKNPHAFISNTTYSKSTLTVQVANSAVAQEIFLRSDAIMNEINKAMGSTCVTKIRVKIA